MTDTAVLLRRRHLCSRRRLFGRRRSPPCHGPASAVGVVTASRRGCWVVIPRSVESIEARRTVVRRWPMARVGTAATGSRPSWTTLPTSSGGRSSSTTRSSGCSAPVDTSATRTRCGSGRSSSATRVRKRARYLLELGITRWPRAGVVPARPDLGMTCASVRAAARPSRAPRSAPGHRCRPHADAARDRQDRGGVEVRRGAARTAAGGGGRCPRRSGPRAPASAGRRGRGAPSSLACRHRRRVDGRRSASRGHGGGGAAARSVTGRGGHRVADGPRVGGPATARGGC